MAGTIIADKIQTENAFLQLNVGATQIATMNSSGIYSSSGTKMIGTDGSIGNSSISGAIVSGNLSFDSTGTSGIRLPAANTLAFHTAGTEDMRITSTGIIAVGTTTPNTTNKLEVSGNVGLSWAGNTFIGMKFNDGNAYKMGMQLNNVTRETLLWSQSSDSDDKITFYTGSTPTERMRINSSGNVGIGTSSPATKLTVYNDLAARYHQIFNITRPSSTTPALFMGTNGNSNDAAIAGNNSNITFGRDQSDTYTEYMRVVNGGGVRFMCENFASQPSSTNWGVEINNTGASSVFFGQGTGTETHINFGNRNGIRGSIQTTSGGTSYNTTSDYRLKENIAPMTGALAKVAQLNPVTYNWKIGGSGQGFIAHELQEIIPDAVTGEKDAVDENDEPKYQMVDTSFLVATLTAAIQEQQAIISDLKARIEVLEA